jgi:hypothetical protein
MEGGKAEDYHAALDKITDIEAIIADKLADQQRRYRTLMRKMRSLNGLSALEVKETLKGKLRASQTASRQNERKRNVGYFSKFVMFEVNISLFQRYLHNNHQGAAGSGYVITCEFKNLARFRVNFFTA